MEENKKINRKAGRDGAQRPKNPAKTADLRQRVPSPSAAILHEVPLPPSLLRGFRAISKQLSFISRVYPHRDMYWQ